ncbi:MAG TPA: amidohydrolase [Candidatus Polarisedimenticolia bacterium]|nr:amidohydrolase [Candidatus Polarisedimenticolia bacterium]
MRPALVLLLSAVAGGAFMYGSEPADLILINGAVTTLDPAQPTAAAVAVRADHIIYVGSDPEALALKGPATRVVDLKGRAVVPGFTDAHGHISGLGFAIERLDLTGTTSARQIAKLVRDRAKDLPSGQWITGRGWDQNDWNRQEFPTRADLDAAAPDHPVALERIDGHAIWANSRAIQIAGVTAATADPAGGQILRDVAGAPTGIFVDNAEGLIMERVAPPTRGQTKNALTRAMTRCLESGLTEVHDAGVSAQDLEIYRELLVDGDFPFRVYAMLSNEPSLLEAHLTAGPQIGLGSGRLTVRAIKAYLDGALGSRGAALLAPYRDDSGNVGLVRTEPKVVRSLAERAARGGFQLCIHAIGDRGCRLALDALEAGIAASPGRDHRFRVEHAQVLAPEEIPRFGRLGIIASMQPTHATSDMYWAEERLGPERVRGAYAWRRLLSSGARLACGSDFPVESEKPLLGFYAAVTRQDAKGWPEGGWFPDQRLTREEALKCFTLDAAYAAFEESTRGSIVAGKLADLTVLSADIMSIPAAAILKTSVEMTIVGGRIAYERSR